jgi:hypothetical protein
MCLGGGKNRAAASNAQVEAERQYALEVERLRQEAATAKAEADARAAEEARRNDDRLAAQRTDAENLRKQLADQEAFRLSEMQRIEAQRKSERDADLAAQAAERKAAEDAATARAAALQKYNTDRQAMLDAATTQINSSFGGFNDNYFSGIAQGVVDMYRPQIAQQYEDARRQSVFRLADRGNLRSTSAARVFGRLDQQRGLAENEAAAQGMAAANQIRDRVQSQRANLLNSVFSTANAAPVITGDNIGEAGSALSGLSRALASPVSLAGSGVNTTPSFGQLSTVFTPANNNSPYRQAAPSARLVGAYGGGSGRLVN